MGNMWCYPKCSWVAWAMGRLAWCGLLLLHVGASFGALAALEGGGARVLALPFNSEVETAWRPPRPHWSGQLQAIGRRQRRHLTRCLNEPGLEPEARPFLAAAGRPALVWLAVAWPARGGGTTPGPTGHAGGCWGHGAWAVSTTRRRASTSLLPCGWMPCCQPPHRSWMGVPCSHAAPLGRPCRWNLAGGDPRGLLCRPQLGPLSGMWPSGCRSI